MTFINTSEGVNSTIFSSLIQNIPSDSYDVYRSLEESSLLDPFLSTTSFDERTDYGKKIIEAFLKYRVKTSLYDILEEIIKIEEGTQKFNPFLRDHVTHSVYVYLLGKMFIKKLPKIRRIRDYDYFSLRWPLASFLHDFGNSPHLLLFTLKKYINSFVKPTAPHSSGVSNVRTSIAFQNLETLVPRTGHPHNSFRYLESRLHSWGINISLEQEFQQRLKIGEIEHGILGALLIIKKLDSIYFDHNPNHISGEPHLDDGADWNRDYFDNEIVDACASIAIHNIFPVLPNINLSYEQTPIPFLLILCDSIQEWDRYSPGQRVYSPMSVGISFQRNRPNFIWNLPAQKIISIENVLRKTTVQGIPII